MSDHYEILDGTYKYPRGKPIPASNKEKMELLLALHVFRTASEADVLENLRRILKYPVANIHQLSSAECRKVIDHCRKARHRLVAPR